MKYIGCYDDTANDIERILEDNDLTEPEFIDMLMEYIDVVKEDYNLQ